MRIYIEGIFFCLIVFCYFIFFFKFELFLVLMIIIYLNKKNLVVDYFVV